MEPRMAWKQLIRSQRWDGRHSWVWLRWCTMSHVLSIIWSSMILNNPDDFFHQPSKPQAHQMTVKSLITHALLLDTRRYSYPLRVIVPCPRRMCSCNTQSSVFGNYFWTFSVVSGICFGTGQGWFFAILREVKSTPWMEYLYVYCYKHCSPLDQELVWIQGVDWLIQ